MLKKKLAFALATLACGGAQAAAEADLAAIRAQIEDMKKSYEARIAALEQKLAQTEAAQAAVLPAVPAAGAQTPAMGGNTAFNPEISVILNGTYTDTSKNPDSYRFRGFLPSGGEIGPGRRGLSLGESEVALSANVDHLFRGTLLMALAPEGGVDTEEAYVETLGLPAGLKLKAGRFLSGIGYLNAQHPHAWDFVDAPLVYQAFYGSRLGNDGVQLRWLAPTPVFLELGAEIARGDGFPGGERNRNGAGLTTLFAHVGDDVGVSHAWQAGLSYVHTRPRERGYEDVDGGGIATSNAFSGRSNTWGADFVWKWAPQGDPTRQNFKFQAEYFQRREKGSLACADADSASPSACGAGVSGGLDSRQSGWYAQGVWQFMPRWRVGYRHDRLDAGSLRLGTGLAAGDFPILASWSPRRDSLMVDWSPSEFSRVRLQFARDEARGPGQADNQFFVQYIMSLGAHGAHRF